MQNTVNHELKAATQVGEDILHALRDLSGAMDNTDEDLTKARAWNNSLSSLRILLLSELRKKREAVYSAAA